MLYPDDVKPFLCHEEKRVRKHAVSYFSNSFSSDADLMPLVLESCTKYGEEENSLVLAYSSSFVQSEESLKTLIERMESSDLDNAIMHYNNIIANADPDLLHSFIYRLERTKNIFSETLNRAKRRISFVSYSTEALWHELFDYSRKIEGKTMDQVDFSYGMDLVEALASRKDLPEDKVLECLENEEIYYGYDEIYLTILAGETRNEKAIPVLFDKLRIDTDLLCDKAASSLVKIGTREVIDELRDCYLGEEWNFRNFSTKLFSDIKASWTEDALLEVFPKEKEIDIKTFLAISLCDLVSEKGVPLVKSMIDTGDYDHMMADLRDPLYSVCKMLNIQLDELEEWKRELDFEDERIEIQRKYQEYLQELQMQQKPQKKKRKIGRNELCPCGSGIKYKKCCLE